MVVLAFDLSTNCIGVVAAEVQGKTVTKILSCPIIPEPFDVTKLGFLKSKKKIKTKNGKEVNAWVKPNETVISEKEKKERDRLVRSQKDIFILENIGSQIGKLIKEIKPDLILVEKNAIFNGILTSVLLAKVMGTLLGIAGMFNIPVKEYAVNVVRQPYNIAQLTKQFVENKTLEELKTIPDVTKRALRQLMQSKYPGIQFQTDDESDACVVFDYWFNYEYLPKITNDIN